MLPFTATEPTRLLQVQNDVLIVKLMATITGNQLFYPRKDD